MKGFGKFIFIESAIFFVMSIITLIEMINFNLFEDFFTLIKGPSSWFIGLSLAYACSSLIQTWLFSFMYKRRKEEGREKGDFFFGFLITLVITSFMTPYIKEGAVYFFKNFLIYFHVILLQSLILLYLLFKIKGNYKISVKYFLITELIVLFHTLIIISYIA